MHTFRRFRFALVLVAMSCSPGDVVPERDRPEARGGPAVRTVDDAGRPVELAAPASRVVSLVPSLTESVAALDAGVLVARTRFDRTPELARLPSLGEALQPNLEALARLRPDLVLVWWNVGQRPMAERVEVLDVPVYRADVQTLDDLRRHFRNLGVLLGHRDRAERLVDSLDAELDRLGRAVAGREPVEVYYSVWHDPPQTVGAGSFIDEVIQRAGGINVFRAAAGSWPRVSLEEIVRRDPDALVLSRHEGGPGDPAWLRGPGWRDLSAVRRGRYLVVDGDLFNRPGPRVAEAAWRLARFLHGEGVRAGAQAAGEGPR